MLGARYAEPTHISPDELEVLTERLLSPMPPSSPSLERYRANASFDWRRMKLFLEGPKSIEFETKLWKFFLEDPVFAMKSSSRNLDETRRLSFQRVKRFHDFIDRELPDGNIIMEPHYGVTVIRCLGMYDWSVYIKYALSNMVFEYTMMTSTRSWHNSIYDRMESDKLIGCLVLTELGHGSNLKKMETRADYDPKTQEFILNSPNLESTKCWVGNLGVGATHGLVYAQMYTADRKCHGISTFVVPIRDPNTRLPYRGIVVGDMGAKIGLNGIDNGYLQFHNYRVPRESLMNRFCDVLPDGTFVTNIKDSNRRFGAALANLSAGRCAIGWMSTVNLMKGLVIAIRYSASRRQFGPPDSMEESPVWEYQLQRFRLLPYLSAAYALGVYNKYICEVFREFSVQSFTVSKDSDKANDKKMLNAELHCLTCALKPLSGWIARDALQECREACGGHGYLEISGIGDIRNDHDANLTYEGDNNVLLQQTSHFLMLQLESKRSGVQINSLMHAFDFINDLDIILGTKFTPTQLEDLNMDFVLSAYKWLNCYLMTECERRLSEERLKGSNEFQAFGDCQAYSLRNLAIVFAEHAVLQHFYSYSESKNLPGDIGNVLKKLGCLYGIWSLEKNMSVLYQGGFASGPHPARLIRSAVVHFCDVLKDEAISLVDVFAPPDIILNSALGIANGQVYENLFNSFAVKNSKPPIWWKELQDLPVNSKL